MAGVNSKTMAEKLKIAHPYNIFYNTIPKIPETLSRNNSVSFRDFLCQSLGELQDSLHIVSKVDLKWLMEQYENEGYKDKPMTLLYGEERPDMEELVLSEYTNVKPYNVAVHDRFGNHHCRMSILVYDTSLRIVISSANLQPDHWYKYNNCFWVSPACSPLSPDKDPLSGESPTNFKKDLITFLQQYHLPILQPWIKRVQLTDFSDVRVCLVTSYPGHQGGSQQAAHLLQTRKLIAENCNGEDIDAWPIVILCSTIGTYLKGINFWLGPYLLRALSGRGANQGDVPVPFCFIYPTVKQVKDGLFGEEAGKTFRYASKIHNLQRWVTKFMYKWKSGEPYRTQVLPKFKVYFRVSPDNSQMAWLLLTSANASRGAWGTANQPTSAHNLNVKGPLYMRNYEVGVLFLPSFFGEDTFKIGKTEGRGFPLLVDLPLVKYQRGDEPWTARYIEPSKQKFERLSNNTSTDWC